MDLIGHGENFKTRRAYFMGTKEYMPCYRWLDNLLVLLFSVTQNKHPFGCTTDRCRSALECVHEKLNEAKLTAGYIMLSIKLSPAVVLHSMIVVPVSVWVIHGPDRDIWPMLYEELTREYNNDAPCGKQSRIAAIAELVPKELAEFWSNRTVDELILLESAIEATKATWNDVITTVHVYPYSSKDWSAFVALGLIC
ncbi:hypothetical protein Tcan_14511 [Toxocara canis]|uniref:Uncharacterized protein n=1 Tax=Toxocara canis TaxID=6265 RepID=A0A0B2V8G1_TOXCA|nr:hypothetical protein Tcan_14511 [Toxocara canis]